MDKAEIRMQLEAYLGDGGTLEDAKATIEQAQLLTILLAHIRSQDAKYSKLKEIVWEYLDAVGKEETANTEQIPTETEKASS